MLEMTSSLRLPKAPPTTKRISCRDWVNVAVLCFINILNYCDRFTLPSILYSVQEYFSIKNDMAGFIQTAFSMSYMISAVFFGYLGDRYNRKIILIVGIAVWNLSNLGSSFAHSFWLFILLRAIFGMGQASCTTVAPTIISDLFFGKARSKILAIFYLAIPVGNGLGYIIGAQITRVFNSWQWSLRITPIISIIAILLIIFVLDDPKRGQCEGATLLAPTPLRQDLKYLLKNKSFMLSTAGYTCVAFCAGALSWWGPTLVALGLKLTSSSVNLQTNGSIFGVVTLISGLIGLGIGYLMSFKLKPRYPRIDPIVCGAGLFISTPFLIGCTYASTYNTILCYGLLFMGQITMNLNWAITCEILLNVVMPTRRSIAVGFQVLVGQALGNVESPYVLGLVADALNATMNHNVEGKNFGVGEFRSLQYSFFIACVIETLGGVFFMATAYFIQADMEKVHL